MEEKKGYETTGYEIPKYVIPEYVEKKKEKATFGQKFIGFIFPVIGIILFLVKRKEHPDVAKNILFWSLLSMAMNFVSVVFGTM